MILDFHACAGRSIIGIYVPFYRLDVAQRRREKKPLGDTTSLASLYSGIGKNDGNEGDGDGAQITKPI